MPEVIGNDPYGRDVAAPPRPIQPSSANRFGQAAAAVVAKVQPPSSGGGGGGGGGSSTVRAATPASATAPTAMPTGGWASWKDVPIGEANFLTGMKDIWEQSTGYRVPLSTDEMLQMANAGVETLHDLGQFIATNLSGPFSSVLATMPWAQYGLDKDSYVATAGTFGTEYKKITGQDITQEALHEAFLSPPAAGGGIMTASQYAQQLMNDQAIQKSFGWVKYGLDFASWTQTKLSMRTAMGRDVNDAEAATVLQYNKASSGSNVSATVRQSGQQQQPQTLGVAGSVVR